MKHKLLFTVGFVLWFLLFVNLTKVVVTLSGSGVRSSSVDLDDVSDQVYFDLGGFTSTGNLLREVTVSGWAFVETDQDNSDKYVKLIFSSLEDNSLYEVYMDLSMKRDVVHEFSDLLVPVRRVGVSSTFSPLGMNDGEYVLFVYVYENDESFGVINTGRQFRKENRDFSEIANGLD